MNQHRFATSPILPVKGSVLFPHLFQPLLARISHQVSSREFVRAALARRDGRFDRKRVSYTLRIEPFVATQSSDAFTDSQQEPGEKCGLVRLTFTSA